jgi:hypothetical protein
LKNGSRCRRRVKIEQLEPQIGVLKRGAAHPATSVWARLAFVCSVRQAALDGIRTRSDCARTRDWTTRPWDASARGISHTQAALETRLLFGLSWRPAWW